MPARNEFRRFFSGLMALSDRRHHDVADEERFLHTHGDHATPPPPPLASPISPKRRESDTSLRHPGPCHLLAHRSGGSASNLLFVQACRSAATLYAVPHSEQTPRSPRALRSYQQCVQRRPSAAATRRRTLRIYQLESRMPTTRLTGVIATTKAMLVKLFPLGKNARFGPSQPEIIDPDIAK